MSGPLIAAFVACRYVVVIASLLLLMWFGQYVWRSVVPRVLRVGRRQVTPCAAVAEVAGETITVPRWTQWSLLALLGLLGAVAIAPPLLLGLIGQPMTTPAGTLALHLLAWSQMVGLIKVVPKPRAAMSALAAIYVTTFVLAAFGQLTPGTAL